MSAGSETHVKLILDASSTWPKKAASLQEKVLMLTLQFVVLRIHVFVFFSRLMFKLVVS